MSELETTVGGSGRPETTIKLKIVEAKKLPAPHELRHSRDCYVVVALDQEEIFRTATVEKSLSPFFGEEYNFRVPRDFQRLTFYICEPCLRCDSRLGKVAIPHEELLSNPTREEQWYSIRPIDADSEVQGKIHLSISLSERLLTENDLVKARNILSVKVLRCAGLSAWGTSGLSDPYCQVMLLGNGPGVRSEVRRGIVRRRTVDPVFDEKFEFIIDDLKSLRNVIMRVSVWHTSLLSEDIPLGQVNLSLGSITQSTDHTAWYILSPRPMVAGQTPKQDLGQMRLKVTYSRDYIFPRMVYEPMISLLLGSLNSENLTDSTVYILTEVYKDRTAMAKSLVRIFHALSKLESLLDILINREVTNTTDPNTLFRGNSLASKLIDESMKIVGQSYLQRTLQSCIDEIFEAQKPCEIDTSRLTENDNVDINKANLLFFIEKILSAITASGRSCPQFMCRVFAMLRDAAVHRFPDKADVVCYTAVSGFVFLRFFAPAILNPKLFNLRHENPNPVVGRTLTLISKSIQSLGNIAAPKYSGSLQHKETHMAQLNMELTDHIKEIKEYLTTVSDPRGGVACPLDDMVFREGFLVKRSQGRKKNGPKKKNFKTRYFCLTNRDLRYAKKKGESPLCTIPSHELLAVERVDDETFGGMKFMFQLRQPERILYMQARNSVDLMEWLSALSKACSRSPTQLYHSGAFLNGSWSCCKSVDESIDGGCKTISLSVRMLAHREDIDLERELHRTYKMFLEGQAALLSHKDEATRKARCDGERKDDSLPPRLATLCELLVFIKNLELTSATQLAELELRKRPGSFEHPYKCPSGEALVIK